jgi:hypothetical protein
VQSLNTDLLKNVWRTIISLRQTKDLSDRFSDTHDEAGGRHHAA